MTTMYQVLEYTTWMPNKRHACFTCCRTFLIFTLIYSQQNHCNFAKTTQNTSSRTIRQIKLLLLLQPPKINFRNSVLVYKSIFKGILRRNIKDFLKKPIHEKLRFSEKNKLFLFPRIYIFHFCKNMTPVLTFLILVDKSMM